jgi:hypothetical protein
MDNPTSDHLQPVDMEKRRRYFRAVSAVFYIVVLLALVAIMNWDIIPMSPFMRVISGCIAVPAVPAVCVFILIRGFRTI